MEFRGLSVEPSLEEVSRVTSLLRKGFPPGFTDEECALMEVGLAEALTNVVVHGFKGRPPQPMQLSFRGDEKGVAVEIIDDGTPIPPHRLQETTLSVFDFDPTDMGGIPEGGMGLELLRAAFDTVDYKTTRGRNRLRLWKALKNPE